jgi:hypothetical protein
MCVVVYPSFLVINQPKTAKRMPAGSNINGCFSACAILRAQCDYDNQEKPDGEAAGKLLRRATNSRQSLPSEVAALERSAEMID